MIESMQELDKGTFNLLYVFNLFLFLWNQLIFGVQNGLAHVLPLF